MPNSSAIMERSTSRAYRPSGLIAIRRNSGLLQCARCRETVAAMDIDQRVRESGKRMTVQRRLVLEALERAGHHITADEIAARIRKQHPQIHPSTVYRNLDALEGLRYVTHTHIEDRV